MSVLSNDPDLRRVQKFTSGAIATTFPTPPPGMRLAHATPDELAHHGLPPRPDRDRDPALHGLWLKHFDRELQFLIPEFVEIPRVRSGPRLPSIIGGPGSPNWSGAVVAAPSGTLIGGAVVGSWIVPPLKNVDGGTDYCLIWIGIDGDPTLSPNLGNDLVQAGVQLTVDGSGHLTWLAFWEWLSAAMAPHEAPAVGIMNQFVQFNADFEASIWLTSATTANVYIFTPTSPSGQTTLTNVTITAMTAPPNVSLIGGCAEWIVERPGLVETGSLATLANYGSVEFSYASAATVGLQGSVLPGQGSPIVMVDPITGVTLSTGKIVSGETVVCTYG